MAKRGQGEGTISKLPNGSYCGRLTVGYDDKGKQKRKAFYGKTKREVQEKMNAAKVELDKDSYIEPSRITFGNWLDIWVSEYKKRNIRESTYNTKYRSHISRRIKPALGKYKLKDLRAEIIQKFINTLIDEGLATETIKLFYSLIHESLKQAVTNELINKNVAEKVIIPKVEKKATAVLTPVEQSRFIEVAKHSIPMGDIFILILATGLRIGEATALTWDDIDFDEGILSVNKTATTYMDYELNKVVRKVNPPKTKAGNRQIPLVPSVLEMLQRRKLEHKPVMLLDKRSGRTAETNLVFPSKITAKVISPSAIKKHLKIILEMANIDKDIHPHSLRHTFATRGLENGIELKVMQEFLGHSDISMTANTYTHVLRDKKKDSIMKIADTLQI